MSRLIWGVSYIQVDRWIEGQDLESRLEVKARGAAASGAMGSELRRVYEGKVAVDISAGKGGIDVGNYIFPFVMNKLSIWKRRGCRNLDTDDSVGGL